MASDGTEVEARGSESGGSGRQRREPLLRTARVSYTMPHQDVTGHPPHSKAQVDTGACRRAPSAGEHLWRPVYP